MAIVDEDKCDSCGKCVAVCNTFAHAMTDRKHTFDLNIASQAPRTSSNIDFDRLLLSDGRITSTGGVPGGKSERTGIDIRNLEVKEPVWLAFKLRRTNRPVRFDLKIDGETAAGRTFFGESLATPAGVPFTKQDASLGRTSWGEPPHRPEPPYFLIWLDRTPYMGDTTIELDEAAKQELRSVGYLQ